MSKSALIKLLFIAILGIFMSCNGENPAKTELDDSLEEAQNPNAGKLVQFNGRLFSIPSPVQISALIKGANLKYNPAFMNEISKQSTYTTAFKQALNLGVYGTDLGYLSMYDQLSDAAGYFAVVKVLSKELNIMNSFSENTLKIIEKNKENKDSLITIMSSVFRDADSYLMDGARNDIAILILAGGWVESAYMLTSALKEKKDQKIIERIGEQKHPLDNLIELMRPYYNKQSDEYDKLLEKLVDLATIFDGVEIEYTYEKSEIKPKERLTIINSSSKTTITEYQLKSITSLLASIRADIVK